MACSVPILPGDGDARALVPCIDAELYQPADAVRPDIVLSNPGQGNKVFLFRKAKISPG